MKQLMVVLFAVLVCSLAFTSSEAQDLMDSLVLAFSFEEGAAAVALPEPEYRAVCERLFADTLEGAPLVANNSMWRQFPDLSCERWFDGNRVLVGDALHTAHFSIGSGTRLALEDVIALVKSLQDADWKVPAALQSYQAERKPVLDKLVTAARASCDWYEIFAEHMALDPRLFALSYIQRAGRVDAARLRQLAPRFTRALDVRGIDLETAA